MVNRDKRIAKRYDPGKQKINQPRKIKVQELVKEGYSRSFFDKLFDFDLLWLIDLLCGRIVPLGHLLIMNDHPAMPQVLLA